MKTNRLEGFLAAIVIAIGVMFAGYLPMVSAYHSWDIRDWDVEGILVYIVTTTLFLTLIYLIATKRITKKKPSFLD